MSLMNAEGQWNVYRTRFLVRARKLAEPLFFVDALGREQAGQAGDYLVESSDGLRRIAPRIIFEDIYVLLDSPPLRPRPAVRARTGSSQVRETPGALRTENQPLQAVAS